MSIYQIDISPKTFASGQLPPMRPCYPLQLKRKLKLIYQAGKDVKSTDSTSRDFRLLCLKTGWQNPETIDFASPRPSLRDAIVESAIPPLSRENPVSFVMWYLLSREQLLDRVSKTIVSPRREDAFDDLHHELIHIPLPRALMSALEVARHNACLLVPPTEGTSNHIFPAWECTCTSSTPSKCI